MVVRLSPMFICSSVQGLWALCGSVRCVPVTCNSEALSVCHQSIFEQLYNGHTCWVSAVTP